MNSLTQLSKGIFSTRTELRKLAGKTEAKILLLSDSHGAKDKLSFIIDKYGKDCDALFFSGDGSTDLLSIIEDAHENPEIKENLPPVIAFVKGNNDPYQFLSKYNPSRKISNIIKKQSLYTIEIPNQITLTAGKRKILLVHGSEHGIYYSPSGLLQEAEESNSKIIVFGHTHVPVENNYKTYMVNPGSISLPRQQSKPGFAFLFILKKAVYSTFLHQENRSKMEFTPFVPFSMF